MPVRYRPDALSLHVNKVRKMLPGRSIARLRCPTCHRPCQMLFVHPDNPEEWKCKLCQQFTTGRNGQYSVSALARARNAIYQFARERMRHAAAQDVPRPPQPQQTGSAAPGDQEETA